MVSKSSREWYEGAIYSLAQFYKNGKEIEKDLEKSFYWYQKAAENGFIKAQYDLALLYQEGKKIEKNCKKLFIGIKR